MTARAILVAAGARPAVPPIAGLDQAGYLASTDALELSKAPARLAVIGAGPVGLELGQMLGNFGSRVTFIARRDLAPRAESRALVNGDTRGLSSSSPRRAAAGCSERASSPPAPRT